MEQKELEQLTEEERLRYYKAAYERERDKGRVLADKLAQTEQQGAVLEEKLHRIKGSVLWRISKPLRLGAPDEAEDWPIRQSERDCPQAGCEEDRTKSTRAAWYGEFSGCGGSRKAAGDEVLQKYPVQHSGASL